MQAVTWSGLEAISISQSRAVFRRGDPPVTEGVLGAPGDRPGSRPPATTGEPGPNLLWAPCRYNQVRRVHAPGLPRALLSYLRSRI